MSIFVLSLALAFGFVSTVFAETGNYTWQQKFKRGLLNTASFFVEIPASIQTTSNEKNLLAGWTVGLVTGTGEAVARLLAGVLDMVTCPFDFPIKGKGPMVDPEFAWEKPGVKYT